MYRLMTQRNCSKVANRTRLAVQQTAQTRSAVAQGHQVESVQTLLFTKRASTGSGGLGDAGVKSIAIGFGSLSRRGNDGEDDLGTKLTCLSKA
ncbi:hypothetical protein AC578_4526 [Pseudocercospora eumusae]|uniref:Uncharacterized protein n=1 Tax=Pseudocercospora eumusae TaxID=321146 RepID=A0A139HG81_9PEZI|nr:hypothetical protein AC578_4526 [Pseudocercospora eumusae]